MANTKTNPLADALGTPLPAGLASLSAAEQAQLVALLANAKQRQRKALEDSAEAALSHIPMLLRGAVRKVLFS